MRRRFGYRRLQLFLEQDGFVMNHKKFCRLYHEKRLQVRRQGARKRAVGTRVPMAIPQGANQRSRIDFLSDAIADGHRFRILTVQTRKGVRSGPGVSPVPHPVAKYRRPALFGTIRIVLPQPIWESC